MQLSVVELEGNINSWTIGPKGTILIIWGDFVHGTGQRTSPSKNEGH